MNKQLEELKKELEGKIFDIDSLHDEIVVAYGESEEVVINAYNEFYITYENVVDSIEYIIEFDYLNDYEIVVTCVEEYI